MERIELTPWFYYDVFNNGKRTIHVPSTELKRQQRLILCKYFKPNWTSIGIKEIASIHCGKKWLMKLDIKDFFNSITEEQIKDIINLYVFSDDDSIIEDCFSICTINGKLPTGAPTSPYIANLILKDFDVEIESFCSKCNVKYSRYMDDLFFSTDSKQYMLSLVELEVLRIFKELGFEINIPKIKYISSNKRQQVLGLGVNNRKPVLTKDDKRKYRAYFYNLIYPLQYSKNKQYETHEPEILGHLAYIKSVDKEYYKKIVSYILNLLKRWNLGKNPCLKRLLKILSKI